MKNDVIDVEVKDMQIEQFLSEKKELVLKAAQRTVEAYLEVGKHLKEVNEKLATYGVKSRWKAWLEDVGFDKQSAYNAMAVYGRYGESKIDFTDSTTILQQLSKPSNDPEKVALVEQKLAKGEKMTVAQVKEALKKATPKQRAVISQASYELDEEERTDMTREEIEAELEEVKTHMVEREVSRLKEIDDVAKSLSYAKSDYIEKYKDAAIEYREWQDTILNFYKEHHNGELPFLSDLAKEYAENAPTVEVNY